MHQKHRGHRAAGGVGEAAGARYAMQRALTPGPIAGDSLGIKPTAAKPRRTNAVAKPASGSCATDTPCLSFALRTTGSPFTHTALTGSPRAVRIAPRAAFWVATHTPKGLASQCDGRKNADRTFGRAASGTVRTSFAPAVALTTTPAATTPGSSTACSGIRPGASQLVGHHLPFGHHHLPGYDSYHR